MSSKSETGHAVNSKNAGTVKTILEGSGADYQPIEPAFELAVFGPQVLAAQIAQDELLKAETKLGDGVNERETLFDAVGPLGTVVVNSVSGLRIAQNKKDNIEAINKKLQGKRIGKIAKPVEGKAAAKTISTSQMGFINRAKNLGEMIETLKLIAEYVPKQDDRKITTLEALHKKLDEKNVELDVLYTTYNNALAKRDDLFYKPETGLMDTIAGIKGFAKTGPGKVNNVTYKQLVALKFTNPRKK